MRPNFKLRAVANERFRRAAGRQPETYAAPRTAWYVVAVLTLAYVFSFAMTRR